MPDNILKWFVPYVVIQSFGFEFAKDSLNYSSPFFFMALRYLIAAGILLSFSRRVLLNRSTAIIAAITFLSTIAWILGLSYVSPGDSSVLNSTSPLFAIPLALLFLHEKPLPLETVGAAVGFLGVVIYSTTLSHGSLLEGVVLSLIAASTWAAFSVLFRKSRKEDSASLVGTQYLLGSLPFLLLSVFYHNAEFNQNFFIDLTYMAIPGGAVQLFLWNKMLKVETVAKITTLTFAIPALTVAVQSVQTFALPSSVSILGAGVMFLGIYISNRSKLHEPPSVSAKGLLQK